MVNPADTNERPKVTRCQIIATDICPECGSLKVRKGLTVLSTKERICLNPDCLCYWEWPEGRGVQNGMIEFWRKKRYGVVGKRGRYKKKAPGREVNDAILT